MKLYRGMKGNNKGEGPRLAALPILCVAFVVTMMSVRLLRMGSDPIDHFLLVSETTSTSASSQSSQAAIRTEVQGDHKIKKLFKQRYSAKEKEQANTKEAEHERQLNSPEAMEASEYLHYNMEGYPFLKLLLRVLTVRDMFERNFEETHLEPSLNDRGRRNNGGCDQDDPNCVLTWDGWARAMITGDVLKEVLDRNIPGAVVEVGVFKGGISAYLQGMLLVSGEAAKGREMWLVDSFAGLPPPTRMTSQNDKSANEFNSKKDQGKWAKKLSYGLYAVRNNLQWAGLLDAGNVHFLEGYVEDTLPGWTADKIAFLRVDVDIYSATYDTLHYLYPKLQKGGAVLFDDHKYEYAREAVYTYRKEHGIDTPIQFLPGTKDPMAYWFKE